MILHPERNICSWLTAVFLALILGACGGTTNPGHDGGGDGDGGQPECTTDLGCDDENICTDDACVNGQCQYTNNSVPCDDGNACSTNDHCQDGVCAGDTTMDCDDDNVCTTDTCDDTQGCVHINNSAACEDGDLCTVGDICEDGDCVPGTAKDCSHLDGQCLVGTCDSSTGDCETDPRPNGTTCDDGQACSTNDHCQDGVCTGDSQLDCDDDNVCTTDTCDDTLGCVHAYNQAPCDDGNACTENDTCEQGFCSGDAVDCDDGNVCTTDSCDPQAGCDHANNTDPCEDGDDCTVGDTCQDGGCQPGAARDCDDSNVCTDDSCVQGLGCVNANNSDACDDGNSCTEGDYCQGGTCHPGAGLDCDDDNPCTDDLCDTGTGCYHEFNTDSCDDDDPCTMNDVCYEGNCIGEPLDADDDGHVADGCPGGTDCNDSDPAINPDVFEGPAGSGVCDDGIDNDCDGFTDVDDATCGECNQDSDCDDGNICNGQETCVSNTCQAGTPRDCNDDNQCTDDFCSPIDGCVNVNDDTNTCSDGDPCTVGDRCSFGYCQPGSGTLTCDDHEDCTDDECVAGTGCVYTPDDTNACDDGDPCTVGDSCSGGSCQPGTGVLACDDSEDCTDDECVAGTGCVYTPDDTNACDDQNLCTSGDHCVNGSCVGTTVVCDDSNPCTDNDCDPATGCFYPPNDANTCNDGSDCTVNDRCFDGQCVGDIRDRDSDTYGDELCGGDDCDDTDASIHPGAPEICGDDIDNDCDHLADEGCSGCSVIDPNAELIVDNDVFYTSYGFDAGDQALNVFIVESTSYNVLEVTAAFYDFACDDGSGDQGRYSAHVYDADPETGLPTTEVASSPVQTVNRVGGCTTADPQDIAWATFTLTGPAAFTQGKLFWVGIESADQEYDGTTGTGDMFLPLSDAGVGIPYLAGVVYIQADAEYYQWFGNWGIRVQGCGEGPWLVLDAHASTPAIVAAGSGADVTADLNNRGFADSGAVTGILSCDDSRVTVTTASADYGAIAQGATAGHTPDYTVSADANAFGIYPLLVESSDGANSWLDSFGLYVQGSGCTTDNRTLQTDNGMDGGGLLPEANDEFGNFFVVDATSFTLTSVQAVFIRESTVGNASFRVKVYSYRAGWPDQLLYTGNWVSVTGSGGGLTGNFPVSPPLTFHEGNTFFVTVESQYSSPTTEGDRYAVEVDDGNSETSWINGYIRDASGGIWAVLYYAVKIRPHGCQATELRYDSHTTSPAAVNPGDSVGITVTLANDGAIDATGVTATLSSSDPDVTVTTATASYGTVASGGTAASQTPYQVQVAAGADSYQYVLPLTITDGVNTWEEAVPLRLAGGHVDLTVSEFTTNLVGNDIHYHIEVTNNGNVDCINQFRIDLYEDLESAPSPGQEGYLVDNLAFLGVGESRTYDGIRLENAPSGTYDAYLQVDTNDMVGESNEGNNVAGPSSQTVGTTGVFELLDPERKWFPQDMPVRYRFVNGNSQPGLGQNEARTAVENGFQHWEDVATASITFSPEADTTSQGFVYDGHNTMTFNDPDGELGSGALAACAPYYNTAQTMQTNGVTFYRITDSDIVFNNNVNFCTHAEAAAPTCFNQFDIEGVATHEEGHLLGLDHPPVFDATMYYAIGACDATKVTLEESDINGVTFIYPQ